MNALVTLAFVLLLSLSPSSRATVSFYTLKDAYDMNSGNPQVYRYDEVSNFRSGTQASITTRIMSTGFSSDIAIDEQGRFYLVSGLPTDTSTKQIWYWNSLADWAANTNGGLLGQRNTTFQVSGFSMYKNELYFLDGSPNGFGNKTLRKWASATIGTRSLGTGLGFEIDAGGAVWFLEDSNQTSTSGTLYRWSSINDFLNNTNGTGNGGAFNFTFSGNTDQIGGLAVPEPSSSLLLLTSLGTLSLLRRRTA